MTSSHRHEIHLNFDGIPVVEGVGIDPDFIGRAVPAFTGLLEALCVEPGAGLDEQGEVMAALVGRLNVSSCILRMQEADRMTPHGLERFGEIIDSFTEEDQEDTVEVLNGITDQAFGGLKKFLSVVVSAETTFRVEHDGQVTEMDDLEAIREALKLLRGLRKQETTEEGLVVRFAGYLPQQRKVEFIRKESAIIEAARIHPKATGLDDLLERIQDDRVVSLVTRQTGEGKPTTTVMSVE